MRDPNRIAIFSEEFAELWKIYCPDWRFGQLINNLQSYAGNDLFYMEEEELLKLMKEYFNDNDD